MKMKLSEIAVLLGGELKGDPDLDITGVAGIEDARPGQITFAAGRKNLKLLEKSRASAVLVVEPGEVRLPAVKVPDPYLAFAKLLEAFHPAPEMEPGIDRRASLGERVRLGRGVKLFPFVCVGDDVRIGDGAVLHPGVSLGDRVTVGEDTVIHANVSIYAGVTIGRRVIIHSGAVIGSDGFGFVQTGEGAHHKIPQVGTVCVEDDVEIGANVCIDRATTGVTLIEKGAKMDNLVHVAHNNVVGANTLLLAQAGLSGSCKLGKNVTLAGQAGTIDHVSIGDNAIVIAQSGVAQDVPPGGLVSGSPAIPHNLWRKVQLSLMKLPELVKNIRKLEKTVEGLRRKIEAD
jgi:UDP-3-O-[3-hydroxymyristoyl] glucosamine N-acyltransferase